MGYIRAQGRKPVQVQAHIEACLWTLARRFDRGGRRTALLAEHLDVGTQAVEQATDAANGSLIGAIEALRGDGRSLVAFQPPNFGVVVDAVLRENDLLDPERPTNRWRLF